ncbi:bactofilin family protein [Paraburkholderia hospita]|uniref:bactofilin family protein n=1 Tax=Paraburkholderia hospita TaxID=169430 RepID=UPI0008A81653|nr:polymer-forming cytoskeletal protein [Paraburkholderia hospita]SEI14888.1 Polymer-forming protein [Paraburkholderia hospita]
MSQTPFLMRVGIGLGLMKRAVPDARMQNVNDSPATPPSQPRRAQSAVSSTGTSVQARAAVPTSSRQGMAATSQASPRPVVPTPAPQITDGLPVRANETDIHTVIPSAASLNGDLTIEESIVLRCVVRGNVTQEGDHQVVLTDTGGIHGTLRAHTAVIGGTVEGDVFADRVVVLETGVIHGNVEYVTLAMKEGATVNGLLSRMVPNVLDGSDGASVSLSQALRQEAPVLHAVPLQEQERVA